jgi:sugar phosphate isomerase/epimerase
VSALARLSLNQATVPSWTVREAVDGCARAGVPWIGLWRDRVAAQGLVESARLVRDAGVRVSSLCRGGFFPAPSAAERQVRIDDNARALDEAAEIGTDVLVLVCGGLPEGSRDLAGARRMVEDGIAALVPHAAARGVRLAIEPLHPMFAADRSVVTTLTHANDIAERIASPSVGLVIDVYHVWWDPTVEAQIERAAPHTVGFHVNDWIVPLPDLLRGRGMMGDGCIELRRLREAVDRAGYAGPIEVEIFNDAIGALPGDDVVALLKERYVAEVLS